MIKIEEFLARTGRTKADVLRALGEDPKSSLLSAYSSGRSKPSFDMCQRLLLNGMTIAELFGEEVENSVASKIRTAINNGEPRDVVIAGLKEILNELETKQKPNT